MRLPETLVITTSYMMYLIFLLNFLKCILTNTQNKTRTFILSSFTLDLKSIADWFLFISIPNKQKLYLLFSKYLKITNSIIL